MRATILTIGDELLIGQVVDTNSAWIAAKLNAAGIAVERRLSVGDRPEAIMTAMDEALAACDVVISTGGIGPTRDDITKEVAAALFGCELVHHPETYARVEQRLSTRGIPMNALNRTQALVPACAEVLPNDHGTAPGLWLERAGHILVVLPGVPFEMEALMEAQVLPRLRVRGGSRGIVHRTMITARLPESMLAERIAGWEDALPESIKLAYLPYAGGVRLRLSAYDVDVVAVGRDIDARFAQLETLLKSHVVGYGEQSIERRVAELLAASGATLAVAESCTGGALAGRFTAIAGASEYFLAGVVAYSNAAKTAILGVDAGLIEQHGAVSEPVARAMAEGVRRISGADYALATTGIAGPGGGTPAKPVGSVWIALATPAGTSARLFQFGNLRKPNIERTCAAAIEMLREALSKQPPTSSK